MLRDWPLETTSSILIIDRYTSGQSFYSKLRGYTERYSTECIEAPTLVLLRVQARHGISDIFNMLQCMLGIIEFRSSSVGYRRVYHR